MTSLAMVKARSIPMQMAENRKCNADSTDDCKARPYLSLMLHAPELMYNTQMVPPIKSHKFQVNASYCLQFLKTSTKPVIMLRIISLAPQLVLASMARISRNPKNTKHETTRGELENSHPALSKTK